jgi:hypothetical protein
LSYAQAAELTWPQLMHALAIEPDATKDPETEIISARQDEIFSRIAHRRLCLPIDLLRIPADDLVAMVAAEFDGKRPNARSVLSGLRRYVGADA